MARKKRTDKTGHVLRNGEMQRASDGLYMYRYNNLVGQRKTVYSSSLMELRSKEQEIQRDLQDGIDTTNGDMTLNELFDMYMKSKTNLRDSSRYVYASLWENSVEHTALGKMKIVQIKQMHILSLYSDMVKSGLSESTVKGCHKLINSALEMAVSSDMIRKNPAKDCAKSIGGGKTERKALTREEQKEFMDFVNDSNIFSVYSPLITFALSTGLRASELSGLRWEDVDLKNNIMHVRQQLTYRSGADGTKYRLQPLKTSAGIRDIPLTEDARSALIEQKKLNFALGIQPQEVEGVSDFVFLNKYGNPRTNGALNRVLSDIVKDHNEKCKDGIQLPHISMHILRHTFCTRMAESGLNVKSLQVIMGHSNIQVTLDIYTQIDPDQIQKDVEAVQDLVKVG